MDLEEAVGFYHSLERFGIRPGLERIGALCERLGSPQDRFRCVHAAGTNGKGSTCTEIASVLTAAGCRTGLYTSPYVIDFRERIRLNGEMIPPEDLIRVTQTVRSAVEALTHEQIYVTEFEAVTAAAFQTMYDSCGQNIDKTATLLTHMDTVMADVDGQQVTFYVGDNGTIIDSEGKIYDLNTDIASIPDEVLVAYYGDNTDALDKALETKRKVSEVDGESATVSLDATGNATDVLDNVASQIDRLRKQHVNIPVNAGNQATGGMNSRPVIPAHATGYIATGPTLTNQGWIGEDGIEAVSNWATGGAVVPLTNTKYMLPIADAIADGMAQRGAGGGQTYNLYINDAKVNDDPAIQAAFINLMETLARKGAMNVGR